MACQICLDNFRDLLGDLGVVRVQKLCGGDSHCKADVCSRCLLQHIQTTLDACIRGMLPRVRCPICLTSIAKAQWSKFTSAASTLVSQYEELADATFTVTTPCCHSTSYTHLPECRIPAARRQTPTAIDVSISWREQPEAFQVIMESFLCHRVAASRVVAFLVDARGFRDLEGIVYDIMAHIDDDERRGALFLSFLNRFPVTTTGCCGMSFCFTCKGAQCTGTCYESSGFDENTCMVRCRQCRVMLVVTEGCDSVDCPCGLEMSWANEITYSTMAAKGLLSVDLLDLEHMKAWEAKRKMLTNELTTQCEALRLKQLKQLIIDYGSTLQRLLAVWRRRDSYRKSVNVSACSTCTAVPCVDLRSPSTLSNAIVKELLF